MIPSGYAILGVYDSGLGIAASLGWLHHGVAYWCSGDERVVTTLLGDRFGCEGWRFAHPHLETTAGSTSPRGYAAPSIATNDIMISGRWSCGASSFDLEKS